MSSKSKFFSRVRGNVAIVALILSLIVGTVFFFQRKTLNSYRPTPGVPTLSFSLDPESVKSGQNFDLIVKVNPNGADFHAFELYVMYDPLKVDFQNTTALSNNIVSSYPLIISYVNVVSKTIAIVGTRTGTSFKGSQSFEIARVQMKSNPGTTGKELFSWGPNTKLGNKIRTDKLDATFNL